MAALKPKKLQAQISADIRFLGSGSSGSSGF